MRKILYLLLFLFSVTNFAQNDAFFNKANDLYNQGKYAEAIENYSKILASGNHSEALYYNLANAHYKLNHIAPSIFYYEKALQLAPTDSDIKNNLAFARNMTIDAVDTIPEAGLSKLIKNLTNTLTFDNWAKVSVAFVFCFVLLFLIYYFSYSTLFKRLAFIGSLTSLALVCISLFLAFHKYNLDRNDNPAIVFVQETTVKSEPNSRSDEAFKLHEGTKVQVLDTVSNWKKIKLADGKTGWIVSEDIKLLNH